MRNSRLLCELVVLVALSAALPACVSVKTDESLRIEVDHQSAQLTILFKNRPVLVYARSAKQYKPYIKELFDLSGYNVLLNAPPDHEHHHGIMYAVMVNGINYWQEREETGIQRSVRLEGQQVGMTAHGLPHASFVDVIEWLDPAHRDAPDGEKAFLRERRTIGLTVDERNREIAVHWSAAFEVDTHAKSIVLTGDPYNGLGVRLSRDFDSRVTHRNAEKTLDPRQGDPNISKARWSAASVSLPAQAETVAVFGDPANQLGDPVYFLMYEPFAYISATQALNHHALEYPSGARFQLNYLVTVYPEVKTSEFLQRRARVWENSERPATGTIAK